MSQDDLNKIVRLFENNSKERAVRSTRPITVYGHNNQIANGDIINISSGSEIKQADHTVDINDNGDKKPVHIIINIS